MRFKRRLEIEEGLEGAESVPFISVLFLLLLFIVLSGGLVSPPGMQVDLPKVFTGYGVSPVQIKIVVSSANILYLDGRAVNDQQLRLLLRRYAAGQSAVLIAADRNASVGRIAQVWDICRLAGVRSINIATAQE
jgi:biopolymer transport protein ExbD